MLEIIEPGSRKVKTQIFRSQAPYFTVWSPSCSVTPQDWAHIDKGGNWEAPDPRTRIRYQKEAQFRAHKSKPPGGRKGLMYSHRLGWGGAG